MEETLIELKDIYKIYEMGDEEVRANDGISLTINRGEFVAIVGKSGSGKSTLMNIIGALDVPSSGEYLLGGKDVGSMTDNQLADIRNRMIGFIFQQYNLLPKLNLLEMWSCRFSTRGPAIRPAACGPWLRWSVWAWRKNGGTFRISFPAGSSRECPSPGLWRETRP